MFNKPFRWLPVWTFLLLSLLSGGVLAEEAGIDKLITSAVEPFMLPFVKFIFSPLPFDVFGVQFPWIVLWLVVAATIFTFYFGFIQFRAFAHSIALVSAIPSPISGPIQ